MATITISVKDEVDKEFRDTVKKRLGQGKGVLGKAVEEALQKWVHDERQRQIADERLYEAIIKRAMQIWKLLKQLNKSVKHTFIANRTREIERKRRAYLNDAQKRLIVEIAEIFKQ